MKQYLEAVQSAAMSLDKEKLGNILKDIKSEYATLLANSTFIAKKIEIARIVDVDSSELQKSLVETQRLCREAEDIINRIYLVFEKL